jgi:hypothetical protein
LRSSAPAETFPTVPRHLHTPARAIMRLLLPLLPVLTAAALPAAAAAQLLPAPERSGGLETTRYDEVMRFMEATAAASPLIHLTSFGYTMEGRTLPVAVVGRVSDASPEAVRASGRTVLYLQGNIHAGEVEGKEVLLMLLRDVAEGGRAAWLDSLVLLVAPIYNADGNERVALTNRPLQHGPVGGMGTRANAQGLDLNRDHTKLNTPEARSLAALLRAYDPHVVVDLHATNGTHHGYHLTYSPPLHPNTDRAIADLLWDEWLPDVTRAIRARDGWEFYHYGNVPSPESPWAAPAGAERGWYTFDHRPRFGTNYAGLRNRFAILSEAYAYLTFPERIDVTRRFVDEILAWAAPNAGRIRRATEEADRRPLIGRSLAVTATFQRSAQPVPVLMGAVEEERHPYTGERMLRRLEVRRPETMPVFIRFRPVDTETVPAAYYVPAALSAVIDRLHAHGVRMEPLDAPTELEVEALRIDSTAVAAQPFQGHHERTLWGTYRTDRRTLPAGTLRVPMDQPLARLAFTLLEPRSDDGFVNWNVLDDALEGAAEYPIIRTAAP